MATGEGFETTDVLICGCGPTGAMLSGYLGRMGVLNVVLEKESGITTDPRGIALDEDGIRLMQGLGIPRMRFVGGVHHDLQGKPFLTFDTGSSEGNTGHVAMIGHSQPRLEESLRSSIAASPASQLRVSCTLTSITEDDEWVYVTYTDANSTVQKIRARFLVGADGKTGFTRKNYLEPRGIRLEWAEETKYEEVWVALNWKIRLASPESHPSFPLWKLGYTAEQVYDAFFPLEFRFLCNPRRPAVCGRFGLAEQRLWRVEFVVLPGEDGAEMATARRIREVVMPYFRHAGSRYGLPGETIEYPEDCIEVLRARPFKFSARSCDRWARGRVILCGDAAHVFPPFGGQGIASGFRDAIALSWRLAIACRANSSSSSSSSSSVDHGRLLEGWYLERKQQLEESLAATVRNGAMVNSRNPVRIFIRDWTLWFLQLVPAWRHRLELGPKAAGPFRYTSPAGVQLPFPSEFLGGICLPQTYCVSMEGGEQAVRFTDDVIFGGDETKTKTRLFQLVVLLPSLSDMEEAIRDLSCIAPITDELCIAESTFFVPRTQSTTMKHPSPGDPPTTALARLFRSAQDTEFAASALCRGRPAPRGYDEMLLWTAMGDRRFVVVRPDRFVFAACRTRGELVVAAEALARGWNR